MSSAAIDIQAPRVALRIIFQVITFLRSDFRGEKFMVHKVGYSEVLDMPIPDMRGSIEMCVSSQKLNFGKNVVKFV